MFKDYEENKIGNVIVSDLPSSSRLGGQRRSPGGGVVELRSKG